MYACIMLNIYISEKRHNFLPNPKTLNYLSWPNIYFNYVNLESHTVNELTFSLNRIFLKSLAYLKY